MDTLVECPNSFVGPLFHQSFGVDRLAIAYDDAFGKQPWQFLCAWPGIECTRDPYGDNLAVRPFDQHRDPALKIKHLAIGCACPFWKNDHHLTLIEPLDRCLHGPRITGTLLDWHGVELLDEPSKGLEVEEAASGEKIGLAMTDTDRDRGRIKERLMVRDHQHAPLNGHMIDTNAFEPIDDVEEHQQALSTEVEEEQ